MLEWFNLTVSSFSFFLCEAGLKLYIRYILIIYIYIYIVYNIETVNLMNQNCPGVPLSSFGIPLRPLLALSGLSLSPRHRTPPYRHTGSACHHETMTGLVGNYTLQTG